MAQNLPRKGKNGKKLLKNDQEIPRKRSILKHFRGIFPEFYEFSLQKKVIA